MLQRLLIHAGSGVAHRERDVSSLRKAIDGMLFACGNADHPAGRRYRIPRIDGEVEDRELQLVGIDLHLREFDRKTGLDPNARIKLQESYHSAHQLRDIHDDGLEVLLARERKHALGQRGTPEGTMDRVVEEPVNPGIFRLEALLREFEAAQDRGEYVVEVVRHAAGQLSDSLHLLRYRECVARALQRFLGPAAFRHVPNDLGEAYGLATLVSHHANRRLGPEVAAVLANAPAFAC